MSKLIVITGCTATGKTKTAVELAKRINGEVISADSMQIYRGMNIGTAKATTKEMQGIRHHMLDIASPFERFTVAEYQGLVLPIIEDIQFRGRVPIICGGTGLYINSILFKMTFSDYDENIKNDVKELVATLSKQELWEYLNNIDPNRASELSVNDVKRVSRAIEIALSKSQATTDETQLSRFDSQIYILNGDRAEIYDRINKRVDIMIEQGLLDEVKNLLSMGIPTTSQAIQAIGYKELSSYLQGETTLEEAVETIKKKSRNYAKRQLTWFRRYYPNAIYLDYNELERNLDTIEKNYYGE